MAIRIMKIKKSTYFIFITTFIIIFLNLNASAQKETEIKAEAGRVTYKRGRLYTVDGNEIYFSSITIGQDVHVYMPKKSKQSTNSAHISADSVLAIEIEVGSKAKEMGSSWFIAGLVGSIWGVMDTGDERLEGTELDSSTKIGIVAGVTAGMTLIGLMIGHGMKEYETVLTNPNVDQESNAKMFGLYFFEDKIFLCMSYKF